jgi:LCP family protein required for cell wall assembly
VTTVPGRNPSTPREPDVSSTPGATLDLPPASDGDDGHDNAGTPPLAAPPRRRDPLWAKLIILFGALLLLVSGGVVTLVKVTENRVNNSVHKVEVPAINNDANGNAKHASVTGPKNILLVGIDPRDNTDQPSDNKTDGIRSDSIIILHVNDAHDQAYLVSIPRDTKVSIPAKTGPGTKYDKTTGKINAAFAEGSDGVTGDAAKQGGLEMLAETIRADFNISFDAAAVVDFSGFEGVVDYIGGVDMYVDEDVKSIHIGVNSKGQTVTPGMRQSPDLMRVYSIPGVTPVEYTVGWHHFAGWQALDYSRQRHVLANGDGDYGRQRHQQQLLKAIFKKVATNYLNSPKLPGLISKVGGTMTIADGGISLTDWVWAMRGIGQDSLVTMKTNGGQFNDIGSGYEQLNDTSLAMLEAVRTDTMATFATQHQDWVASS